MTIGIITKRRVTPEGMKALQRMFGVDDINGRVSKAELQVQILVLNEALKQALFELFKENPNHKHFQNMNQAAVNQLRCMRFSKEDGK